MLSTASSICSIHASCCYCYYLSCIHSFIRYNSLWLYFPAHWHRAGAQHALAEWIMSKGTKSFLGHGTCQESALTLFGYRQDPGLGSRRGSCDLGCRHQVGLTSWGQGLPGSLASFWVLPWPLSRSQSTPQIHAHSRRSQGTSPDVCACREGFHTTPGLGHWKQKLWSFKCLKHFQPLAFSIWEPQGGCRCWPAPHPPSHLWNPCPDPRCSLLLQSRPPPEQPSLTAQHLCLQPSFPFFPQ